MSGADWTIESPTAYRSAVVAPAELTARSDALDFDVASNVAIGERLDATGQRATGTDP